MAEMESKKMQVQKTWYTPPAWHNRGPLLNSPQPSPGPPPRLYISSAPTIPLSPARHAPMSMPMLRGPCDSVHSSISPLPGFATFLPRYRPAGGVRMVLSAKTPAGVSKSMTAGSDSAPKAPRHSGPDYAAPFLSAGPSLDARSAGPSRVWSNRAAVPRQAPIMSSAGEVVYCPSSTASVKGALSGEADEASRSSPNSSLCSFRPVGVVLKEKKDALAFRAPVNLVRDHSQDTKSALLYCAPPSSHVAWNSVSADWTPTTSYGTWTHDSKGLRNSKQQARAYSQDNSFQPDYGLYPFSPAGNGRKPNHVSNCTAANCNVVFHNEIPESAYCASQQTSGHLFQDGTKANTNSMKGLTYSTSQGSSHNAVHSAMYTTTSVAGICTNVNVVTVRADDTDLFMANTAGTTSLTERELSLHDAKMHLDEATCLSEPPAPPTSPCGPLCALPYGATADSQPAQPYPGEEGKPHPGLDMLSDVSLLVESLKTQGPAGGGRNNVCVPGGSSSSSSGTAISGVECSSYASEEDSETALCPPQATYVGTLPPAPDSTMTFPAVGPMDGTMLPEEDLEYTAMTPASLLHDACYPPTEVLQQQYTLMLPPKKSSKFTKGADTHPHPGHFSHDPKKSSLYAKISSNDVGGPYENSARRGKCRKKTESKEDLASKALDHEAKRRRKSSKSKGGAEKCMDATSTQLSKASHQKGKSKSKKHAHKLENCAQNIVGHREGDSSCTETVTQSKDFNKTSCDSKNIKTSLKAQTDPAQGVMKPVQEGCSSVLQLGFGGDGSSSAVCKSEEHTYSLPCSTQLISLPQPEPAFMASTGETKSAGPQDHAHMNDNEYLCPKVHFDPLIIAEEEVTSTQPHDVILTDNTENSTEDHSSRKKSKWKRRSHSCVTCLSNPSSDEESLLSQHSTGSAPSKPASSARGSSSHQAAIKSGRKCPKSVKSEKPSLMSDITSSKESREEWRDRPRLSCKVCGRTFASSNNLSRHQRIFHPSIYMPDKHIMELPLTSPQRCTSCTSVSVVSSMNSDDNTPSILSPTKSSSGFLPSPPAITLPSVKMSPTSHSSPFQAPLTSPSQTSQSEPEPKPERSVEELCGKKLSQQESTEPQPASASLSRKRRRLRKTHQQQDQEWKPPMKWESEARGGGDRVTRRGKHGGGVRGKGSRVTTRRTHRGRSAVSHSSRSSAKCPLNFRTKKRTRINSTIPCPYCERLFSVMSNLKRHTKREHSDVNVFICNICPFKINMRRKLNKHMKSHAGSFPHPCTCCLARFRSETEVTSHKKSHEIPRFPCEDCKLIFYTKEHLADHLTQYHAPACVSDPLHQ